MILNEIKNIKSGKKELREFGVTIGIVFGLLGAFFWWRGKEHYFYFLTVSSVLIVCGLLIPIVLKPLQKVWMALAIVIGSVMTKVILCVLFYFILTPLGLTAKLLGKQFLDLQIDKTKKSHWNYRIIKEFNPSDYEKQF